MTSTISGQRHYGLLVIHVVIVIKKTRLKLMYVDLYIQCIYI